MTIGIIVLVVLAALLGWAWNYDRRHPGTKISRGRIKAQRRVDRARRRSAARIGRMPRG